MIWSSFRYVSPRKPDGTRSAFSHIIQHNRRCARIDFQKFHHVSLLLKGSSQRAKNNPWAKKIRLFSSHIFQNIRNIEFCLVFAMLYEILAETAQKKILIFFQDRVVFWALKSPLNKWEVLLIF